MRFEGHCPGWGIIAFLSDHRLLSQAGLCVSGNFHSWRVSVFCYVVLFWGEILGWGLNLSIFGTWSKAIGLLQNFPQEGLCPYADETLCLLWVLWQKYLMRQSVIDTLVCFNSLWRDSSLRLKLCKGVEVEDRGSKQMSSLISVLCILFIISDPTQMSFLPESLPWSLFRETVPFSLLTTSGNNIFSHVSAPDFSSCLPCRYLFVCSS